MRLAVQRKAEALKALCAGFEGRIEKEVIVRVVESFRNISHLNLCFTIWSLHHFEKYFYLFFNN